VSEFGPRKCGRNDFHLQVRSEVQLTREHRQAKYTLGPSSLIEAALEGKQTVNEVSVKNSTHGLAY